MGRLRLFVAVEVGAGIRGSAVALQQTLARSGADVRWVATESMHLTLLFLGDTDQRDLAAVCGAVADAVAGEPPFTLAVSGVGAFPTPRRPKTVWAGVTDGTAELRRLHALLEPPLFDLGVYRKEDRGYTPHLTLGRVGRDANGDRLSAELPKHAGWSGGQTVVEEVVVFSSDLRREGPVYTPVGRGRLLGRPPALPAG